MEINTTELQKLHLLAEQSAEESEKEAEIERLKVNTQDEQARPQSAKSRRKPSMLEGVPDISNTRYIVSFDTELSDVFPSRSDSQTDLIIQKLKDTLSASDQTVETDVKPEDVFDTSVPEDAIDEARRKQRMRDLEKMAKLGRKPEIPKKIPTMCDIVNGKADEHYKRGLECSEEGRFEDSITAFTKAINLQPNNINLFIERAESYLHLCDFQSAIINFKRALSLEPHNPYLYEKLAFIYYLQGQCYFDAELYNEALESFTHATDMRPTMQGYHTRAMTCLAALGRNQECLALLTRRIEADSTGNPELYVMRARLHDKCGNATLCYYDVRDALTLQPAQKQANEMMKNIENKAKNAREAAVRLTVEGKLQEALSKISTSIDTNPSVAEFHVFRGALQRRLTNFNSAIDDYLIAMDKADHNEKHPAFIDSQKQLLLTYNDFAVHCYQKGFYEEAIVLLNKAVKGEKMEKGLYINRGDCFFKQGDLAFALADYQQALELDESSWESRCRIAVVHNELGISSYQSGLYQEAMQRFTAAIEQNPKVGQFYIHRARARYMIHDILEAQHDVLVSLHLDPDNDEVIPLASRLFPGKSIREVIQSESADAARKFITNIIGSQSQLKPIPPQSSKSASSRGMTREKMMSQQSILTLRSGASRITTANSEAFKPSKMVKDIELIHQKKMVNKELKNLLDLPYPISHKTPRTLPPVVTQPKESGDRNSADDLHKQVYTWKKFTFGFSPS